MGKLILFEHGGLWFILQSYLKNDFANICEVNGDSFRLDFTNKTVSTSVKQNDTWIRKSNKINITEVGILIDKLLCKN